MKRSGKAAPARAAKFRAGKKKGAVDMNMKKMQELIEMMNSNDLAEIEVEMEGMKIKLVKKGKAATGEVIYHQAPAVHPRESAGTVETKAAVTSSGSKEVKSPMVGTFYRSPSPEAEPYVEVGSVVKKGDVLCIVEAMKLMNEIKAEFGGKIAEIMVENAESVEFGQPLFRIEPL
ncbi:MAG: acetyl-CoA carboxylase biotin carboxyl carrier protein [Candidatus Omnitrophica bacterium]|nr:acetyl-CoA carboxylase biotin carboxyl carrier protein [Candidatus Omnitrophota bacterium]MDD4012666.1 acetyl-CoA carboxylase biotin carboxyl carrier protein [Candidatus Omnitrophota bacterium]